VSKFAAIVVFSIFSMSVFDQQAENAVVVGSVFEPAHAAVSDGMQPVDYSLRSERAEK